MKVADTLTRIARSRERAYKMAGSLRADKMKAISKIITIAGLYSRASTQSQIKALRQIKSELLLIIPDPRSRYTGIRDQIESLIQLTNGNENQNPDRAD